MGVLPNMAVVKVLNAKIANDLKDQGEIVKRKVQPISAFAHGILYASIYPKKIKGLNDQIDGQ